MIPCQEIRERFVQGVSLESYDCQDHLHACPGCQSVLDGIALGDRVLAEPMDEPIAFPSFDALAPVAAKAASDRRKVVARKRRLPFYYTGLGAAAAAACLIIGIVAARAYLNRPPLLSVGVGVSSSGEEKRVRLASGADVTLSTGTVEAQPSTPNDERLFLARGQAAFRVPKLPRGHSLSVRTPDAEIVVHGTRFQVVRQEGDTFVQVTEGLVEVRPEGVGRETVFLSAGQSTTILSSERFREALRGQVLQALDHGDFASADQSLNNLFGTGDTDVRKAEAKALQAWSLAARGNRAQAIAAYRQAMALLPQGTRFLWADNACAELALLLAETNPVDATAGWRAYLARFPAGVHASLAKAKLAKGR